MVPFCRLGTKLLPRTDDISWAQPVEELGRQWVRPGDVFSVLLLLGGEIVNRALAQLAGDVLTPVTFSFGWTSYAITLMLACVGDARLMPSSPDGPCLLIHGKSGYVRSNNSWIIGRLMRDYDFWMDTAVRMRLDQMLEERHRYMRQITEPGTIVPRPGETGLCISVYEPSVTEKAGEPARDFVYWGGLIVALIQLAVSAIPIVLSHDWGVLVITLAGTLLAFATGSLPHWKEEKWCCRRSSKSTYIMTRGNGAQHAIVVLGNGHGLNLDDLAVAGQIRYSSKSTRTRVILALICLLWVSLLIAAAGITTNTWYLLAVGGIGIVQNVTVAGLRRHPRALGVHLKFCEVIGEMETMQSLMRLEERYPDVGKNLLPVFFPGKLLAHEEAGWREIEYRALEGQQKRDLFPVSTTVITEAFSGWITHARTFEARTRS